MNIVLYSLPGISKTDTPVFSSLANQEVFFFGLTRQVISTGFYPPYFKNSIKVDVSDYNLTTSKWNYCSLDFNNKTYYYFIKNKRYINESIVEFDIEMDTIQTYMFDVTWINSMVERFSIRRWNPGYAINRDYIRENISKNSFSKVRNYVEYNTDAISVKNWMYVVHLTNNHNADIERASTRITMTDNGGTIIPQKTYISPSTYVLIPHEISTDNTTSTVYYVKEAISEYVEHPYTSAIFIIPFAAFDGLSVDANSHVHRPLAGYYDDVVFWGTNTHVIKNSTQISVKHNTGTYNIPGFIPGTQLEDGTLFSEFNNPLMLDVNYTKLSFGDPTINTEYPLHRLTSLSINYAYWADVNTGNRYYNLYDGTDYLDNKYFTIVCNSNILSLDLKNNLWQEYLARNKATFGAAIAETFARLASGGLLGLTGLSEGKGGKQLLQSAFTGGTPVFNEAITQKNLQNSPNTIKASGNGSGIQYQGDEVISSKFYLCDDFKECCEYFEMFGYRVDWHVDTNLFTMNHRHLFNYIKVSEMNILIGDKATEENFIARFKEGIRMWDTYEFHSSLIVTQVKLCCKESPYNCEMGDCLKYDNLESWISTN